MTEKAVVMEITDNKMILLTQDGRFVSRKIVFPVPQIGTEIAVESKEKKSRFMPYAVLVAAVLFLTFFAGRLWHQFSVTTSLGSAVSFVTIDINPSVELGIDANDNVISAVGLNADGEKILQGKDLICQKSEAAVAIVVDSAIDYGYLAPEKGNDIIINVSGKEDGNEKLVEMAETLPESAKKVLEQRELNVKVEAFKTDIVVYEESKELGVSAGKYALFLEAREAGINIDPEDVAQSSIVHAIKNAGGNPGEIIIKAKQEKEFINKVKEWKSQKEEKKEFERRIKEEITKYKKEKKELERRVKEEITKEKKELERRAKEDVTKQKKEKKEFEHRVKEEVSKQKKENKELEHPVKEEITKEEEEKSQGQFPSIRKMSNPDEDNQRVPKKKMNSGAKESLDSNRIRKNEGRIIFYPDILEKRREADENKAETEKKWEYHWVGNGYFKKY